MHITEITHHGERFKVMELESAEGTGPHYFTFLQALHPSGTYMTTVEYDMDVFGGYEFHRHADFPLDLCCGYVAWTRNGTMKETGHELISVDPLTLSPSLACRICTSHGFITQGRWVAC